MKLYDSYTQKIHNIDKLNINIYNCGPTVYNHIHIGNARPLIVFDVLYRYLIHIHKNVVYLQNITDIDDKIINEAYKQQKNELEISNYYYEQYEEIKRKLNIFAMKVEKVSDNINGMIEYINCLIDNKKAYIENGNVYFDTSKVSNYGKLANRKLDEQIIGERVSVDDHKKNETDFVLWKKTNIGIQWSTPWGKGRPGWHTECAYLIDKYFHNNLTIHGGGIDLKFPHHENENAQNNALYGCNIAQIWIHIGHINIKNQKMSKSLNNFILVKDLLDKYSYQSIRWFMYKTNYKNPLDFNNEIMEEANKEILKINKNINLFKTNLYGLNNVFIKSDKIDQIFLEFLDNDLNIVNAISRLYEIIKQANSHLKKQEFDQLNELVNIILNCLEILGVQFDDLYNDENIKLIQDYFNLVNKKDFTQSDLIRKVLIAKGLL